MTDSAEFQKFLDAGQYSNKSILRYEQIFGHTWVSTGGEETTTELLKWLNLSPGQRVLDIGCGTGGSAFFMARKFGAKVVGIDLSTQMIQLAQHRLQTDFSDVKDKVELLLADATTLTYPEGSFDVIYSRDTVLHIPGKEALYQALKKMLVPGGKLLVTDYCRGDQQHSQKFLDYVESRGYDLRTVAGYGTVLKGAGFRDVEAIDMTKGFQDILRRELKRFRDNKNNFLKEFTMEDYDYIVEDWESKLVRCGAGDQAWGLFHATR